MPSSQSTVRVLYASSTGTAEDIAEDLAQKFLQCGVSVKACGAIDDYEIAQLPADASAGHFFIFIVSTCGDGQAPITMRKFWRFVRRSDLPTSILSSLKFAMFGLGDRAYVKFNAAARRLSTRLCDLGATMILPLALGDDSANGGYDEKLFPWTTQLLRIIARGSWLSAQARLGPNELRVKVELSDSETPPSRLRISRDMWRPEEAILPFEENEDTLYEATVSSNNILTNSALLTDDKEVRHIELDVSGASMRSGLLDYNPGDIVHVMPRNKESVVDAFFEVTNFNPNAIIHVTHRHCKTRFGRYPLNIKTPCPLRDFVSAQLDLTTTPRRKFFERLAHFAKNPLEKEKLLEFASASGVEALAQYARREKRTVVMSMRDFPSAKPPLGHLIDMIPVLKSRPFSIASSSSAHQGRIHICASIVRFKTPLRFHRVGVCSSFFLRLEPGGCVPIFLEKATSLRFDETKPAILVGPGTGVAPMRSFLFSTKSDSSLRWLFFGCRTRYSDFLYEKDWTALLQSKQMTTLTTAFSRADKMKKTYVQDKMLEEIAKLWKLLSENDARVYVAGSAGSMPKDVRQVFVNIASRAGRMSDSEAECFVRQLETEGRLQMECW